jgi:MarR family transcriptional regulator, organic hydroperoxide resistance regulator
MSHRLQAEIKQSKPFPRPSAEAFLGILRTAAVLEHHLAEVLKPYGITSTQYNVLRILRGAGKAGMCGRDIGERLISRVPDISRLLDRMEDMDLIHRERDAKDRRQITARITSKGLGLLERATPELELVESTRLASIDPDSLQGLIDTLDAIRAGR